MGAGVYRIAALCQRGIGFLRLRAVKADEPAPLRPGAVAGIGQRAVRADSVHRYHALQAGGDQKPAARAHGDRTGPFALHGQCLDLVQQTGGRIHVKGEQQVVAVRLGVNAPAVGRDAHALLLAHRLAGRVIPHIRMHGIHFFQVTFLVVAEGGESDPVAGGVLVVDIQIRQRGVERAVARLAVRGVAQRAAEQAVYSLRTVLESYIKPNAAEMRPESLNTFIRSHRSLVSGRAT